MVTRLDTPRVEALFRARSVAMIGASDKSMFSKIAFELRRDFGALERTFLINPNKPTVHGVATYANCAEVPGGIDCAYVMVPRTLVPAAIEDAAAAGATSAVVLSGGFAETDDEGRRAQDQLVEQCRGHGMVLLGPNHLGFADLAGGNVVCTLPGLTRRVGGVALISQSGALAGTLSLYAARVGVRFSFVATTGNEAMVTAEEVAEHALELEETRALALFAETIRRPDVFLRMARRAHDLGKAVVVLKAGSSDLAARTAAAHTGALVGDDAVIDAVFRQEGVIRVENLEELLATAHVAAHTGRWHTPGAAVTSISGGACDIIADRGEALGLHLPALAEETERRLAGVISALGHAQNPLDVTGAATIDPSLMGRIADVLADDPAMGFMLISGGEDCIPFVSEAMSTKKIKAAFAPVVHQDLTAKTSDALEASGLAYVPSVRDAVVAMTKVSRWSVRSVELDNARAAAASEVSVELPELPDQPGPWSEVQARRLLEGAGVPFVPAELASSEDEAVAAATRFGEPVAMKIVSAAIEHKSDIGGVKLRVQGEDEVRQAYRSVRGSADALTPAPVVDGVLISPMRSGGVELLVGVARDASWGLVLAVALGGVFVEVLQDSALLRLPATRDDARRALLGLRGAALLQGARGGPEADIEAVVDAVVRIGAVAEALGDRLEALEVNPLLVDGERVEALDALVNWRIA